MSLTQKHKLVLALSGASGSIYAKVLLDKMLAMKDQIETLDLVFSKNALDVWKHELGHEEYRNYPFRRFEKTDFSAPFASGSARYTGMIICPCSMGTLGRIAHGISDDLVSRAADVMLKERRKLILVTRETPLSLIHINNMKAVTEAGGIICPASPSFYAGASTLEELAGTVVNRVIDLLGMDSGSYRWGEKK
ncbi:MAG TPA: UbiX family flavin prenyltransferase [Bacteroidia bacterium]|nr:UbiX family flavin prenyltransferase [Bacteroidia bacterium]